MTTDQLTRLRALRGRLRALRGASQEVFNYTAALETFISASASLDAARQALTVKEREIVRAISEEPSS